VRGLVEGLGSTPAPDLRYEAGEVRGKLETDQDGWFVQEVPCGAVRLLTRVQSTKQLLWEGVAPADGIVLQLPKHQELGRLEVLVRGERGPIRGAEVYAGPMGPRRECGDPPGPPLPRPLRKEPWSLSGLTDAAGVAVLPGLAPGLYKLEVTAKGYAPFNPRSVEVVGDLTRAEVDLHRGLRLGGRVVDERGQGVGGVVVVAVPLDAAGKSEGTPTAGGSGASGAFLFAHLPAASHYRLEAHPVAGWLDPEPVRVPAGGPAVVRLRRPPVIWGRVVGADGRAPEWFEVDGREFDDGSGRFRKVLSAAGEIRVTAPDHLPLRVKPPEAGGNLGTLRLERIPLVAWRVVDEAGGPVSGARVVGEDCSAETTTDADGGVSLEGSCTRIDVRKGELRGAWRRGEGDESRVITVRPPSRVRVQAFGEDGGPARGAWELRCENAWEDLPRVLKPDARGAADASLPRGTCSLTGDGVTVHFAVKHPHQELVLGPAAGTFPVTLGMPAWAGRVRLTTVPPSDRAWEAAAAGARVRISGLPAGKYTARWTERHRGRRSVEWVFDVPSAGEVIPPER
jgi:hypothetical protein